MSKKNFAKDRVWHVPSSNRISISFARFSVKPCSTNQLYKFIRANQSDTRVRVMWTQQAQNLLIQSPLVIVDSSVCQDLSTIENNPLLKVLKFENNDWLFKDDLSQTLVLYSLFIQKSHIQEIIICTLNNCLSLNDLRV